MITFGKLGIQDRAIRSTDLPDPIDWIFQRLNAEALATGTAAPKIGKFHPISFFDSAKMGKLGRFVSDFLGHIRTSRTHLGHHKKHTIEERIKRRRRSSQLVPDFCTFLCNFLLVFFFYPSS